MKKQLLFITILTAALTFSKAQTIPNAGFESWTASSYLDFNGWESSNKESVSLINSPTAILTADASAGTYAVRLETVADPNDASNLQFGYVLMGNSKGQNGPSGGTPFTQQPSQLNGSYKCNIMTNDTGIIFVQFKNKGTVVSEGMQMFYGVQNTYTNFTINLSAFTGTPDTVLVAAVSSNAFGNLQVAGSTLFVDNLSFGGTGITQNVPNPSFENWAIYNFDKLNGWYDRDLISVKSTDKYSESFALSLISQDGGPNNSGGYQLRSSIGTGYYTNCQGGPCTPSGGQPVTSQKDTLFGYYKYTPMGNDTASVGLFFKKNFNQTWGTSTELTASSTYKKFAVPYELTGGAVSDSVIIFIYSSKNKGNATTANIGSNLIVDNLWFASTGNHIGIQKNKSWANFTVSPNPTSGNVRVAFNGISSSLVTIQVINLQGQIVLSESYEDISGSFEKELQLNGLAKSVYTVNVITNEKTFSNRIVINEN